MNNGFWNEGCDSAKMGFNQGYNKLFAQVCSYLVTIIIITKVLYNTYMILSLN